MEAEGTVVARAVDMVVDRSDRNLIRFFLYLNFISREDMEVVAAAAMAATERTPKKRKIL